MMPAGIWLLAARLVQSATRLRLRVDFRWPALTVAALRLASRLSQAGFRSWRFWRRKWRCPRRLSEQSAEVRYEP
ncbi:hypothetical protein ABC974_11770 [Sphingomonas oligophenolica]|uniref:Uncharacterized protein n=2 Tax=Sphingomonas oligophenolica TaxID=301154 RepID=A0ABU9Y3G2_9SPHN